jgi:hypothetical protein
MNNTVLHILSHDGSLEFKQEVDDAENMVRNPSSNVNQLNAIHDRLYQQLELLEQELENQSYDENQIATIKTYYEKLNEVIGLLQDRINELMSYEEDEEDDQEAEDAYARSMGISVRRRGGRKSRRSRKSSKRRKPIRRKTIRRKRKSIRKRRH